MEAVTDVVFRHVVKKAAPPDVYFTEFTNATGWVHAGDKAIGGRLIKTDDEHPLVAQIWGAIPEDIAKLATHCKELGFDGIDINMGCPDDSATKSGGGAALCRTPELASDIIAAAKTSGLPTSVKCRLGYSKLDEWQDWIAYLLRQDLVNLTVHLRTKKEMSKVPAHHELIPEIIKLRDEIAPKTLITINGDVEDRKEGLELINKYPGIDGIMIGRGIFHNPYCFRRDTPLQSELGVNPTSDFHPLKLTQSVRSDSVEPLTPSFSETSAAPTGADAYSTNVRREAIQSLIDLLLYHLDLYDKYQTQTGRPFDTLKRFFKIYINSFDGAAELRDKLMHTKSTDEVRALLAKL